MTAHIVGPWQTNGVRVNIRGMGPHLQVNSQNSCVAYIPYNETSYEKHIESYATTNLIVAAPDLLAAAKIMLGLRAGTDRSYEDAYDSMFKAGGKGNWDALEAAIAKAIGANTD